ncbi:MAG: 4Fe-4S binding protein [Acidobacteria bacterium]|nr:4Fe-4S binding protein [Acidobacteriota bacterium]NIM63454.1 4Fe-4S binding protein [Acidobacteriota bacterium]NIO60882.1 4Fe-4S binding protein [Acidobacteriota bacterium]NIQ31074.1 4Fe-4S binding protein [Acidobacteriota bacterium]NIQ87343.1 4Fe-4S binding protein [Acidobacteriota bacterium]
MVRSRLAGLGLLLLLSLSGLPAVAQQVEYERQVDVAPSEESIGEGYVTPEVQRPRPRAMHWQVADVVLLGLAMLAAAWLALKSRRRAGLVALSIVCVAYFGFYREGCVCPIGSIQNVAVALVDPAYAVPYYVIAIFVLPLVAALFFGRVFCSGVCALGAIQELVVLKPVNVPPRLDRALGWLKWVYLGLAVVFAVLPAAMRDFVICRFDPFVGLFRFTGEAWLLILGGVFLVAGVFVGRPYCRWLCPYGALLSVFSRYAWRSFSITPDRELDCGLCTDACPYGAIEERRAVRTDCFACGRCYRSCPVHHADKADDAARPAA